LIKGFYGFLSNKGCHATTYKPSQEDAKIAIYLNLICVEFLLEKFGKYPKSFFSHIAYVYTVNLRELRTGLET